MSEEKREHEEVASLAEDLNSDPRIDEQPEEPLDEQALADERLDEQELADERLGRQIDDELDVGVSHLQQED